MESQVVSGKMFTPEDLRPFPKALARKTSGRKRGKSLILTASPVKARMEKELEEKAAILEEKEKRKREREAKKTLKKVPVAKKKKRKEESSSSECEDFSATDTDEVDWDGTDEPEDTAEIEKGDYVLAYVKGEKGPKVYYCALVLDVKCDGFRVRFLKKMQKRCCFVLDTSSPVFEISKTEVEVKLGNPYPIGSSSRTKNIVKFRVDISTYNLGLD